MIGRSQLSGLRFFGPAALFFGVFLLLPLIGVVVISLTEWSGFSISSVTWLGLDNYSELAEDAVFWRTLWQTLLFVVLSTLGLNVIGFSLALLISKGIRGHEFLRIAILLPLAVSPVLAGVVWQKMLGPIGLLNQVLEAFGADKVAFLGPGLAFGTLIVVAIWMFTGFNTLLYYAGLQSLPQDRVDAAAVDGAGTRATVRHVVIPYMRPIIAVVVVLNLIGGWKVFDIVFVLTRGGPARQTEMMSTYLYQQAFAFGRVGYASAIAVLIILLAIASALLRGRIHGEGTA